MDLALDLNGDLILEDNKFEINQRGGEEIRQRIQIRLKLFYQEWFLDREEGTKYYELIFLKGTSKEEVDLELQQRVQNTEGVRSISSWNSEIDERTRKYSATFIAVTSAEEYLSLSTDDLGISI